ncbi:hypothetical protein [Microbulbifer sp. TYP-18]|uniref:hypothetical protein n=1 Tax=Microbulbifer sp. TYP-18 TaxID=3230024 RepID=UPI0034C61C07
MKLTELHDWEIRRIEVEHESKSAKLLLHYPVTNQNAIVNIDGIKRFFASGMMLQNVILDVLIFESYSSSDYLEHCKKLLNLNTATFDKGTVVFYIEPSVGVEVACLCHHVDLTELYS